MAINKTEGVTIQNDHLEGLGLRINNFYKEFKSYPNVHTTDYTLIGLRKESSTRVEGGAKHYTDYTGLIEGTRKLIVRKRFEYIYSDPDPANIGVWIEHSWYTYGENIGLTKIEFKPQTIGEMSYIRRKHRSFVRESLIALGGDDPFLTTYINLLVEHYKVQATEFVDLGKAQEWKDAIQNEQDPTVSAILATDITYEGRTQTVAEFMIEDIDPHIF
jgi:hypothetical protein